ncbi:MAG: macro domain-containing protein [Oscillospiraceae bacterium]|jgi:O-acetyl-ADP-ribose deacetylase (regulator of RNase III)|nr:macro domain-containing protein [Oscillospiraceae bacterium]
MPLTIVHADITKLKVDAIVNAANTDLLAGGGVCGAIFSAAGYNKLQAACDKLAPIGTGDAIITPGFSLPAKHIIHTAGPVYLDGNHGEKELLRTAYTNSLKCAAQNMCESVAFPLISSGIYGYPKAEALAVATAAIQDFLVNCDNDIHVSLVVFDRAAFTVDHDLYGNVQDYIDVHYIDEHAAAQRVPLDIDEIFSAIYQTREAMPAPTGLDDLMDNLDEPFSATLLRLIDAKGKTDAEVYKRANIDRKLFSKIRNKDYRPGKKTVIALCVALELTLDETVDLLECAGFALSHSIKFDVIVEYFIMNRRYDVFEINNVLFTYDQPTLGG